MGSAAWIGEQSKYSAKAITRIGDPMWSKAGAEIQAAANTLSLALLQREESDTKLVERDMRRDAKAIRGFLSFLNRLRFLDERSADVVCFWEVEQRVSDWEDEERVGGWKLGELHRLARSMPLESLADRLEKEASEMVKSGRPAKVERKWFVWQLARIWGRVHGKPPSKSYTSGPFYRFVNACLEPIAPSECKGIEGVIRKVTSK